MRNGEIAHSVIYPFREVPAIFIKFEIAVCKPSFGLEEYKICRLRKGKDIYFKHGQVVHYLKDRFFFKSHYLSCFRCTKRNRSDYIGFEWCTGLNGI